MNPASVQLRTSTLGFPDVMRDIRELCRVRSAYRASEFGIRFDDALARYRSGSVPVLAPAVASNRSDRSASIVSMALDRFVAEARSSAELMCAPNEPTEADLASVEQTLATLGRVYVASEEAIAVGTMSPASFMPGASELVSHVMSELRESAERAAVTNALAADLQAQRFRDSFEDQRRAAAARRDASRRSD